MSEIQCVNTSDYWNDRFSTNWESYLGPQQSRFFAQLAMDNMPPWFIQQIRRESLTVADWGCAQGDGTDVLASYIDPRQLIGIDFSDVAIKQASNRYPSIRFINEDWLNKSNKDIEFVDIIFSSNTLEHFHNPLEILENLGGRAKKAIALALPYRESKRIDEHFYTFLPNNLPFQLNNGFNLIWSKVLDCSPIPNTHWSGEQIFLVYAEPNWTSTLKLCLTDCKIQQEDNNQIITKLNLSILARDEQIASLNQEIIERDEKINSLHMSHQIIEKSFSWKITRPLRIAKNIVVAPKMTTYRIIRSLFMLLPESMKQMLHRPRHSFIRFIRSLPSPAPQTKENSEHDDLTWSEFNDKVLSRRNEYKGVFIQELVIDWNVPLYQRPQHISAALGRLGYLVIYRTDNWAGDNVNGFREVTTNVWITNRPEINEVKGVVRSIYSTAYANTPKLLTKNGKRGVLIYEYIDHIDPEISGDKENINRLLNLKKFAFDGGADFIVASAKKLYQEAAEAVGTDKVILVPNGVDTLHYRNPIHKKTELPTALIDFRSKHKTIVGYFGALAPWLWYEAINELASKRPELGFIFIGPDYYGGASKLPDLNNVLYLGTVDYKILPAYARQFDICFIPFKPGEIAKTTSPLKLFEYFALEKPVVVTADMYECTAYPEVFRGGSVSELSKAIDAAILEKDNESFKAELRKLADQNDWSQRANAMEFCFKGADHE